jgi:hypothetical protein
MMAAPCTPARQCFVPKHKVVLQCDVLWQDAKGVPEPRPTNLGAKALGCSVNHFMVGINRRLLSKTTGAPGVLGVQ